MARGEIAGLTIVECLESIIETRIDYKNADRS
jgi:hypothetical protein